MLTCSPSATAIALSDPNDDGNFIRTIASDALQASALSKQIIATGYRSTAIVLPNDDYGTRFADSLRTDLEAVSATVTLHPYDPVDPAGVVQTAVPTANDKPNTVTVLGDQTAAAMILALKTLGSQRLFSSTMACVTPMSYRHPRFRWTY